MNMQELIATLTIEEKASLCSGADHWHSKALIEKKIPALRMSDGPHGLRKQVQGADHLGLNQSLPATCFPTATTTACSWDPKIIHQIGAALGTECSDEGIHLLLGPGTNLKRSPLCGRNFEYFSEDPYLSGVLATAYVQGVESQGVGTSLKHFAANNQENMRFISNSVVDERTLRELYLASFESVIKAAKPSSVMCSYNLLNGVYCSEDPWLLTDVLRNEWGFDGFVVSDWGAVNNRVDGLKAGLELEMPPGHFSGDQMILNALATGDLDESTLDLALERFLKAVMKLTVKEVTTDSFTPDEHYALAREALGESIVLLKNEGSLLPLSMTDNIAVIGSFAKEPRFQGGGSSYVTPYRLDIPYDELTKMSMNPEGMAYAPGYHLDENEGRYCSHPFSSICDVPNQDLIDEAVSLAKSKDVAVIFAGLPESYETEGYDRRHMGIPRGQSALIEAVAAAQPNTVVVLMNGSSVEMPWIHNVPALFEAYLGGEASGGAIADLIFGFKNPCGKLAETFPQKLSDTPTSHTFLNEERDVVYGEGLFIGYRYYEAKNIQPLFPFGYGLSYTQFAYTDVTLSNSIAQYSKEHPFTPVKLHISLKNIGSFTGKEITQVYVKPLSAPVLRPVKELKGFEKVLLQPGETATFDIELDERAFAYYDMGLKDWYVASGTYEVLIGGSSDNLPLKAIINIENVDVKPIKYHRNSTFSEVLDHPEAAKIIEPYLYAMKEKFKLDIHSERGKNFLKGAPLRNLLSYSPTKVTEEEFDNLLDQLNQL